MSRDSHGAKRNGSADAVPVTWLAEAPPLFAPGPMMPLASPAAGGAGPDGALDVMARLRGTRHVDLRAVPPDPTLSSLLPPQFCLRHGLVPWSFTDGQVIFAADRPDSFAASLPLIRQEVADLAIVAQRPVLADRAQIQAHVSSRHRAALTRAMATRVPEDQSSRSWTASTLDRVLLVALIVIGIGLAMAFFPTAALFALTAGAAVTLVISVLMKAAAALATLTAPAAPARPPHVPPGALPRISILVPLYRERDIASALIGHLEALKYPRDRLEILLVLEEHDEITRRAIAGNALPPWIRAIVVPDGTPRTKPRAMNYALDFCFGDIVGIYDAEDAPEADQLLRVAARFSAGPADLACLQGALDYYNPRQNWLARCFTVEYNTWFRLMMPGMARLGFALPLGGTTCFFRRDALELVGAWDAHNVTEDADLGFRLARHGLRTEMIATTTHEEAACHFVPWVKQRSRWLKGYLVTYFVQMRSPRRLLRDLGLWRFIGFNAHFVTALSSFILAPFLLSFWLFLLGLPHPLEPWLPHDMLVILTALFLLAELQNITLGVAATLRDSHRFLWPWVPTMHFYFPLGCLAAYKALYELVLRPFYWDKTSHGHSLVAPAPPARTQQPVATAAPVFRSRRRSNPVSDG
ncbi:glycosyltransferase family 2 protein [Pseudooceanicola aestuarii]|uniref:glycosyltransferase family 2 protein n=1 Tax=Pseudooceanicola aestuarii TaxID=2697319 RepID=UPI0013D76D30|nr:glycosyltransferase family 2 protein [Pseudooceanicola aestuarii]